MHCVGRTSILGYVTTVCGLKAPNPSDRHHGLGTPSPFSHPSRTTTSAAIGFPAVGHQAARRHRGVATDPSA
eukprot:6207870-Pleurochrysis_carterae.AAC.1